MIDDHIYDKTDTISGLPALLELAGFEVVTDADGRSAYDLVFECKPDLIVLDIGSPHQDIDGIGVILPVHSHRRLPGADHFDHRNIYRDGGRTGGFKAGADDYVKRPCDNREIRAIRANLPPGVIEVDDRLRIDFNDRRVREG